MTLNVSVRLPPFTVITDVRLSVVELDFTSIVYLKTVAEAETAGVTTHQSCYMEGYNLLLPLDERFPIGDISFIAFPPGSCYKTGRLVIYHHLFHPSVGPTLCVKCFQK